MVVRPSVVTQPSACGLVIIAARFYLVARPCQEDGDGPTCRAADQLPLCSALARIDRVSLPPPCGPGDAPADLDTGR
ncbi:MAG: hypothetical protein ACYSWU_21680, partial [Planctomycetota bacterium]